jgi:hypothetical protein
VYFETMQAPLKPLAIGQTEIQRLYSLLSSFLDECRFKEIVTRLLASTSMTEAQAPTYRVTAPSAWMTYVVYSGPTSIFEITLTSEQKPAEEEDEYHINQDDFAAAFRVNPEGTVDQVVEQTRGRPGGGLAAARAFLPYLVRASYAQQNLFLDAILRASTPEDVLNAALLLSDAGGEAILRVAADVLENYGSSAWLCLAGLATSNDTRCRHFVRAIVAIPAPDQAKIDVLVALAHNPDIDTRWLVADLAESVSPQAARAVWRTLSQDPDDQLRATAEA